MQGPSSPIRGSASRVRLPLTCFAPTARRDAWDSAHLRAERIDPNTLPPLQVIEAARQEVSKRDEFSLTRAGPASPLLKALINEREVAGGRAKAGEAAARGSTKSARVVAKLTAKVRRDVARAEKEPPQTRLGLKTKLCVKVLKELADVVAEDCPIARKLLGVVVQSVYPTVDERVSMFRQRRTFLRKWDAVTKLEGSESTLQGHEPADGSLTASFDNDELDAIGRGALSEGKNGVQGSTAGKPALFRQNSASVRADLKSYAELKSVFQNYEGSLQRRLAWVQRSADEHKAHYIRRVGVVRRIAKDYRQRTMWLLFNWWKNTAQHIKNQRAGFAAMMEGRSKFVHIKNDRRMWFFTWRRNAYVQKFRRLSERTAKLRREKEAVKAEQAELLARVKDGHGRLEAFIRTETKRRAHMRELEADLTARQRRTLEDGGAGQSPAVIVVSMKKIIIHGVTKLLTMLHHMTRTLKPQDPLQLLDGKQGLYTPPKCHFSIPERTRGEQNRDKKHVAVCKKRKSVLMAQLLRVKSKVEKLAEKKAEAETAATSRRGAYSSRRALSLRRATVPESKPLVLNLRAKSIVKLVNNDKRVLQRRASRILTAKKSMRKRQTSQLDTDALNEYHVRKEWDAEEQARRGRIKENAKREQQLDPRILRTERDNGADWRLAQLLQEGLERADEARAVALEKAESAFAAMTDQELVRLWVNFHVRQTYGKKERAAGRAQIARNFSTDFQSCEVMARLLGVVAPQLQATNVLAEVDFNARAEGLVRLFESLGNGMHEVLDADNIANGSSPALNLIACMDLMVTRPCLDVDHTEADRSILRVMKSLSAQLVDIDAGSFDSIRDFNSTLIRVIMRAESYMQDVLGRNALWEKQLQPRIQQSVLSLLHQHARGEAIMVRDLELEKRVHNICRHYDTLPNGFVRPTLEIRRCFDLECEAVMHLRAEERQRVISEEMREIEMVCRRHYNLLKNVFARYAMLDTSAGGASSRLQTMNVAEYFKLLCKSQITEPIRYNDKTVVIRSTQFARLFSEVAAIRHAETAGFASEEAEGKDSAVTEQHVTFEAFMMKHNNSLQRFRDPAFQGYMNRFELDVRGFVQVLVLISYYVAEGQMGLIAEALDYLLSAHLLPKTVQVDVEDFRHRSQDPTVTRVFADHHKELVLLFYTYSVKRSVKQRRYQQQGDGASEFLQDEWRNTIDADEFMLLCSDAKLLDNHFTPDHVYRIFASAQQDVGATEGDGQEAGNSDSELVYPEFLEALAAISAFKIPQPFLSLSARVTQFLRKTLGPWIAANIIGPASRKTVKASPTGMLCDSPRDEADVPQASTSERDSRASAEPKQQDSVAYKLASNYADVHERIASR